MKDGDLSNEIAPIVGIRFERVLKTEEGKLNKKAKGFIESFMNLDVNVYILTMTDSRKTMAFLTKWAVPYNKVISVDSPFEVADVVREHDMLYYYDVDRDVLQNVNSRGGGKVKVQQWTSV